METQVSSVHEVHDNVSAPRVSKRWGSEYRADQQVFDILKAITEITEKRVIQMF